MIVGVAVSAVPAGLSKGQQGMKTTMKTLSGLALATVVLAGCSNSEAGQVQESSPAPTTSATTQEIRPPGSHGDVRDDMLDEPPDRATDEATDDSTREEFPDDIDPRDDAYRVEDPEDVSDRKAAQEALERAQTEAAAMDDGLAQQYAVPDDLDELNALGLDWWVERERVLGEELATVATEFRPGEDFNRDEAWVRASYLMAPEIRLDAIDEYPALDSSWASAARCNAEVEVAAEHLSADEGSSEHKASFEVIAEYRWVNGDDGCEIEQPRYFYVYEISMGDSGLATRVDRTVLDDGWNERPSGWEM